jgi:hypothetical protein
MVNKKVAICKQNNSGDNSQCDVYVHRDLLISSSHVTITISPSLANIHQTMLEIQLSMTTVTVADVHT